ncbi:MAG: NUDIX hydrolase [Clostridiales bacterium]|nr:NUDIX hydrolase [Clostridiales bacterium]
MDQKIADAIETLRRAQIDSRCGLPEELFYLVSSLTPIPNVDLWITDGENRVLLAWRKDLFYDEGWHIPGGCIRYGETMLERLHKTALKEIGSDVTVDPIPIAVRDVIRPPREGLINPYERGHHLAVLYRCFLPENFKIDNKGRKHGEDGYLRFFHKIPKNMLRIHDVYQDALQQWL